MRVGTYGLWCYFVGLMVAVISSTLNFPWWGWGLMGLPASIVMQIINPEWRTE